MNLTLALCLKNKLMELLSPLQQPQQIAVWRFQRLHLLVPHSTWIKILAACWKQREKGNIFALSQYSISICASLLIIHRGIKFQLFGQKF